MISLKDLFLYNMQYKKDDTLIIMFEDSNTQYQLKCSNITSLSEYNLLWFKGNVVRLSSIMKEKDKQYFKKVEE